MAVGGVNALEAIESYIPDIALCDLNMPDINGGVCRAMRRYPQFKHAIFIAQTGLNSELHRQGAKIHGVTKPFDFKKLQQIMDTARVAI